MYSLIISSMTLAVISMISFGLAMELSPSFRNGGYRAWFEPTLITNLVLFVLGMVALVITGSQEAFAAGEAVANVVHEQATVGLGLEIIAITIPTSASVLAAGMAVTRIGSAALAVLAEKPEIFGRTLIFLGLAEGLAIYGLVLSILLMGKI
jgi:V/A-type H+-transporting ATPase subunit K